MILTLLIPAADKEIDFSRSGEKRIGNSKVDPIVKTKSLKNKVVSSKDSAFVF